MAQCGVEDIRLVVPAPGQLGPGLPHICVGVGRELHVSRVRCGYCSACGLAHAAFFFFAPGGSTSTRACITCCSLISTSPSSSAATSPASCRTARSRSYLRTRGRTGQTRRRSTSVCRLCAAARTSDFYFYFIRILPNHERRGGRHQWVVPRRAREALAGRGEQYVIAAASRV